MYNEEKTKLLAHNFVYNYPGVTIEISYQNNLSFGKLLCKLQGRCKIS